MKKVFLSLPMSGRTQENIEFTIKAMTKKAKEILGEDIEVSHLGNLKGSILVDSFANPGMYNMVHATSKMVYCDYFMGFGRAALLIIGASTNSEHKGCIMEEELWDYSQRHAKDIVSDADKCYVIYNKKLPSVKVENICEFIPELNIKDKVHSFDLLMHSEYGLKARMEEIKETSCTAYYHMTDIFELFEDLINNKGLVIPRRNSKSLLVKRLNDIDKQPKIDLDKLGDYVCPENMKPIDSRDTLNACAYLAPEIEEEANNGKEENN